MITRDDRLETVAKDIVQHFLGRGFQGKAMVVSIDKATALRMHDKVKQAWEPRQDASAQRARRATTYGAVTSGERARGQRLRGC